MISCSEPGGTACLVPNLIHYARLRWQKGLAVNILIFRQSGT